MAACAVYAAMAVVPAASLLPQSQPRPLLEWARACLAASAVAASPPLGPLVLCRLCAEQARHLFCHDAAGHCLDAAPSAHRRAHACQAGLRQSGRGGAGITIGSAATLSARPAARCPSHLHQFYSDSSARLSLLNIEIAIEPKQSAYSKHPPGRSQMTPAGAPPARRRRHLQQRSSLGALSIQYRTGSQKPKGVCKRTAVHGGSCWAGVSTLGDAEATLFGRSATAKPTPPFS